MPKSQKCVGETKLNELFMVTVVTTKEDLKKAIDAKEDRIISKGELAQKIAKQRKVSKGTTIAGLHIAAGSLVAAPFTGGMSHVGGFGAAQPCQVVQLLHYSSLQHYLVLVSMHYRKITMSKLELRGRA